VYCIEVTNFDDPRYSNAECSLTCHVERLRGTTPYIVPVEFNCGEYCCKMERNYIYTSNGWELFSYDISDSGEDCDGAYIPKCPPNTLFSSDCAYSCDEYFF